VKPPATTEFPQQWKDNLVYVKPAAVSVYQGGIGYSGGTEVQRTWQYQRTAHDSTFDLRVAREQFTRLCALEKIDEIQALAEMFKVVKEDSFWVSLINLLYRNDVTLKGLAEWIEDDIIKDPAPTMHEKIKDQIAEGNGVPDYEGSAYGHLPE